MNASLVDAVVIGAGQSGLAAGHALRARGLARLGRRQRAVARQQRLQQLLRLGRRQVVERQHARLERVGLVLQRAALLRGDDAVEAALLDEVEALRRENLPQRSWIPAETMVELVEHRWNKRDSYMEGAMIPIRFGEVVENLERGIKFRQRLYTVEEMQEIYDSVGMKLTGVFHGSGKRREPTPAQFEVFFEGTKG